MPAETKPIARVGRRYHISIPLFHPHTMKPMGYRNVEATYEGGQFREDGNAVYNEDNVIVQREA